MKQWQERVIQEKKELDERIDKLKKFLVHKPTEAVDETERLRLEVQLAIMESYSSILHSRIISWDLTTDATEV